MKKLFVILTALVFVASVAMAASSQAEKIYKTRCIGCHGLDGSKKAPGSDVVIKGEAQDKIETALLGYKAGTYGGNGKKIMESQVKSYDEATLKDLAAYVAGL